MQWLFAGPPGLPVKWPPHPPGLSQGVKIIPSGVTAPPLPGHGNSQGGNWKSTAIFQQCQSFPVTRSSLTWRQLESTDMALQAQEAFAHIELPSASGGGSIPTGHPPQAELRGRPLWFEAWGRSWMQRGNQGHHRTINCCIPGLQSLFGTGREQRTAALGCGGICGGKCSNLVAGCGERSAQGSHLPMCRRGKGGAFFWPDIILPAARCLAIDHPLHSQMSHQVDLDWSARGHGLRVMAPQGGGRCAKALQRRNLRGPPAQPMS